MNTTTCPICDSSSTVERVYSATAKSGGSSVLVQGLKQHVCSDCGAEFVDVEQSRNNVVRTQLALGQVPRYVLPENIKAWRSSLGLTQRDAAKILGGGTNAFSKYENGEVTQSDAMDNLLWLAITFPGLLPHLAARRNVELLPRIFMNCGQVIQSFSLPSEDVTLSFGELRVAKVEKFIQTRWANVTLHKMESWKDLGRDFDAQPANDEEFPFVEQA